MIVLVTFAIFFIVIFPVIAWKMAKQRGLNAPLYAVLSIVLGIIPIVYMAIKHPGPPIEEPLN